MNAVERNILHNALKCAGGDIEKALEMAGPLISRVEMKDVDLSLLKWNGGTFSKKRGTKCAKREPSLMS